VKILRLRSRLAFAIVLAICTTGAGIITAVGSPSAGATPTNNCSEVSTPGADLAGVDFTGCTFANESLAGLDFTGANLTDAVFTSDILNNAILTGANVTGADFSDESPGAQMAGLVSGNLVGTPAALPSGVSLVDGYFVEQSANAGTTTSNCTTASGDRSSNTYDQFTPPAGTTGLSFDVIGGQGGDSDGGVLGEGNFNINDSPGSGGYGGQGTDVTGSISWSTSDGGVYASPGCGGFYGGGGGLGTTGGVPGGPGIDDSVLGDLGFGGAGGQATVCSDCSSSGSAGGVPGGSGGAFSALCQSNTPATCFVFAGGGGGAGGGGDEPGDNGGDGGSYAYPNGGNDGADSSSCAYGGKGGVNGGGGGAGFTNNGDSATTGGNGGTGGAGGDSDDRNSGAGGGGGGGVTGGGGGGGNDSYDGFGCSGGGGGGAGSSACESNYMSNSSSISVTYTDSCSFANSTLPDDNLNENTSGQVTVAFSGYVPPPPIVGSGSLNWTYGQAVNASLASLASAGPTFSEMGTMPNGITLDENTGAFVGIPTTVGSYPIQVTATNSFGSNSRSLTITVSQAPQAITFNPPSSALFGSTITLSATGGGSGNPVVFSVDPSSSEGACYLSGADGQTATFTGPGSCVIDANQQGNTDYTAAPTVTKTIVVTYSQSCISSSHHALTVLPGQAICLSPGTVVQGSVTVEPGGSIDIEGARVSGSLNAKGAGVVKMCGATQDGSLSVSSSGGPVIVGDDEGAPCSGNTIVGPVAITSNTSGVEFDYNSVNGPLTITGNTGSVPPPDTGSVVAIGDTVTETENVQ
jgi:hypothetical protein